MPKTKRDLLKRQTAYAHSAIERATIHLNEVAAPFQDQHPELAEPLYMLIVMLQDGNKLLENWVEQVWGRDNVDWEAWANTPDPLVPKPNTESR